MFIHRYLHHCSHNIYLFSQHLWRKGAAACPPYPRIFQHLPHFWVILFCNFLFLPFYNFPTKWKFNNKCLHMDNCLISWENNFTHILRDQNQRLSFCLRQVLKFWGIQCFFTKQYLLLYFLFERLSVCNVKWSKCRISRWGWPQGDSSWQSCGPCHWRPCHSWWWRPRPGLLWSAHARTQQRASAHGSLCTEDFYKVYW